MIVNDVFSYKMTANWTASHPQFHYIYCSIFPVNKKEGGFPPSFN